MSPLIRIGLAVVVVAVVAVVVWFFGPLAGPTPAPSAGLGAAATAAPAAPTLTVTPADIVTSAAATPAGAAATPTPVPARRVFHLDPTQSEARFIVDELLFGNPNTVVGVTADVSGSFTVDLDDPTRTTIDPIRVNARTLVTDNRFRNRSINRLILQANRDEYQYITFTPTALEGLPAAAVVGETFRFQVSGDLQIRNVVRPVTFAVAVTAVSEERLEGVAVGTVQRADFNLNIPNVEGVADVSEEVRLELEFVALAE